jgi:peptidoglycan/LPS O-acetylase OafA/YrhL
LRISPAAQPLVWLGRRSLSYYMVHQPVMIGMLTAAGMLAAG